MPDFGQSKSGYKDSEFSGRKRLRASDLIATNKGGYLNPEKHKGNGVVYVVEKDGKYYVADGHHTAANADGSFVVRVRKA